MNLHEIHGIEILDGAISLVEIISCTNIERTCIVEMVNVGLLEPVGDAIDQWQFAARDLRRARTAVRLMNDLDINLAGVVLILDLIEERDVLLARVALSQAMVASV